MAHNVEGNEVVGFRAVTAEGVILTGRKATEKDALAAAAAEEKPAAKAPAKKTTAKRKG